MRSHALAVAAAGSAACACALLPAMSGCAMSATAGAISHDFTDHGGASIDAHAGLGLVGDQILAADVDLRGDIASDNSRFAVGGSVLGGLSIGGGRLLGRVGLWRAIGSSTSERAVVPTFELAGYVPFHQTEDTQSKYGWSSIGMVFGIREDLDELAYTTLFVGMQLFVLPGY